MSLATLDAINKAKEKALREKQNVEKKTETVASEEKTIVDKPSETVEKNQLKRLSRK